MAPRWAGVTSATRTSRPCSLMAPPSATPAIPISPSRMTPINPPYCQPRSIPSFKASEPQYRVGSERRRRTGNAQRGQEGYALKSRADNFEPDWIGEHGYVEKRCGEQQEADGQPAPPVSDPLRQPASKKCCHRPQD